MSTNFPTALDDTTVLPSIASTDAMDAPGKSHDVMHTNLATAVLALETKVGCNNSEDESSIDYLLRNGGGVKCHFGVGHPSTFYGDGDLYFDTTAQTFVGYVQQKGQMATATGTASSGNFTSTASGSTTVSVSFNDTLLILVLCYENSSNSSLAVSSVTSPDLTWTQYTTNHCTYNSRNHYVSVWYAQPTTALASETITWAISGGNVDDGVFFYVPVDNTIAGSDPFVDGGSTGLPASVAVTSSSECTTGTLVAPSNTLLISIQGRDDSTLPNAPTGFTSLITQENNGASRWEYARVATMQLTSDLNGTITSSGLASATGSFVVLAVAFNPNYRSWQPFT